MTNIIEYLHTTVAYQAAVLKLLTNDVQTVASKLQLRETVPITIVSTNINPPPMGVSGDVGTLHYVYCYDKGYLAKIWKLGKFPAGVSNLTGLTRLPSLVDTNGALLLATNWLKALQVDIHALQQKYPLKAHQVMSRNEPRAADPSPPLTILPTSIFRFSWGTQKYPFDQSNPINVQILGATKELLTLNITDTAVFARPPLVVSNSSELLGPTPSPRFFVEQLFGGATPYSIVANSEKLQVELIKQGTPWEEPFRVRKRRTKVGKRLAQQLSETLRDFNTYDWKVLKLCNPDYGVRLRFSAPQGAVEFLLCFECDILQVAYNGASQTENFDFARKKLLKIIDQIFPRDRDLEKLMREDEN